MIIISNIYVFVKLNFTRDVLYIYLDIVNIASYRLLHAKKLMDLREFTGRILWRGREVT